MTLCPRLRGLAPVLLLPVLFLLTACSHVQEPGSSGQDTSSLVQAQRQAIGRDTNRATPQLHLALNRPAEPEESAAPTRWRELAQAKTFLGTLPCISDTCEVSRLSLTLAPAGHWRARSAALTATPGATVEQGCWEVVRAQPLRLVLLSESRAVRADLGFVQDHVLRVYAYNGVQPTLTYHLTQQAEIDAIEELHDRPLADCALP